MIKLTGVFVLATSYSRTAYRRTTIGAAAFHFRVRNGNGCDPDPMTTGILGAWGLVLRGVVHKRRITLAHQSSQTIPFKEHRFIRRLGDLVI